jgi:hypothetical protein
MNQERVFTSKGHLLTSSNEAVVSFKVAELLNQSRLYIQLLDIFSRKAAITRERDQETACI